MTLRYWHWERRIGRTFIQTCPSNLAFPRIAWHWADSDRAGWLSVELCSLGSEPVLGIDVDLTLPAWLARLLCRWGDCRECGVWLGLTRSQLHASSCSRYHLSQP